MGAWVCSKCNTQFEGVKGWGPPACPKCKIAFHVAEYSPPLPGLPEDVWQRIFSNLDEPALGLARLVCQRWATIAQPLLAYAVPRMIAYGSTAGLNASGEGTAGALKQVLLGQLKTTRSIQLAVDQFPFANPKFNKESILAYILQRNIPIDLTLGTRDDKTLKALQGAKSHLRVSGAFNRMHNKIWVLDQDGVIIGSPNVSFSGLEGANLESCIVIRSMQLGHLYGRYLELLRKPDPRKDPLWKEVETKLLTYNSQQHLARVAMAPIVNISDFIVKELAGATKIIIRQFLVSPKNDGGPGADIIQVLCDMAAKGTEIEIYIDEGAYKEMGFVREAAKRMVKGGCSVYTQKPVVVVKTDSECVQHDKLILATLHTGVCRTLLGSAGFTDAVIANENAENFIAVDVPAIYNSLMRHHRMTLLPKVAETKAIHKH